MKSVKVDRLEIRLKGVSSEVARSAVAGLGNEVLGQLSKQPRASRERLAKTIGRVELGTLRTARGTSSSELRRAVATRIASSITS